MSTCNGLKGCIILPDDFLIIEPIAGNIGDEFKDSNHIMYRPNDLKQNKTAGSCGNQELHVLNQFMKKENGNTMPNPNQLRFKRSLGSELLYIELLLVVNSEETQKFSNQAELEAHVKQLVNLADAFYHGLGIRIVLSHMEIWNGTDQIPLKTNADEVLDDFLKYVERKRSSESPRSPWRYADNYHLVYGGDLDGTTLGLAVSKSMCGPTSAGISQDTFSNIIFTGATIAHEIGHNLGMLHDTRDCVCPSTACVMEGSTSATPAAKWSTCSKLYLEASLNLGLGSCLLNVPEPNHIHFGSECGNDIVEEGEECDCGHDYDCVSNCCNATTCELLPGAQCDVGLCCFECQFVSANTECRVASNVACDVAEYCTGNSADCPTNAFIEDGTLCNEQSAICYNGVCLTYDLQCELEWGEGSKNSVEPCYKIVNRLGNQNGNCGLDENRDYIKCSPENTQCGKLLCQGGNKLPLVGQNRYALINTLATPTKKFECKAIASDDYAIDVNYDGLVKDGTLCDTGKICMEGKCIPFTKSKCKSHCSGHGHCTNLGHCHCDPGWASPDCSMQGVSDSECGNHIVEEREECDCGHPDECESNCCNPSTCKFLPGAICDVEACCANCQYARRGVQCRPAADQSCDITEHCSGNSAKCPEDAYIANGQPCLVGSGTCYEAKCISHDAQCQTIWGEEAEGSVDTCYRFLNILGNNNGNCGRDELGEYIACKKEDAKCGKLACQGNISSPVSMKAKYVFRNELNLRSGSKKCYTVAPDETDNANENFGLLLDGSLCATGKICKKRRCVPISVSSCPSDCSGHGICTNLGNCHCDPGWASTDCSHASAISNCGNGVVEDGENCDCGQLGFCENSCCNATTCQLITGAECSTGECCVNCRFASAGARCRNIEDSQCDLEEYCTGFSGKCPQNLYVEDGTSCAGNNGNASCYDGVCLTRDTQCQEIWGEGSHSSEEVCYIAVNKLGNRNGNCGHDKKRNYRSCTTEHSMCGKLQCDGGNRRPVDPQFSYAFRNRIIVGNEVVKCFTVASNDAPDDVIHPGLVKNGTMCGSGKICGDGYCLPMSPSSCTSRCNGHGVCNNLGHCHCAPGWAPPFCNVEGRGGSTDSGSSNEE
ncbi:uncharacterized protein LOC143471228 isoform X2 [Clavelina lepadiformis]